MTVSNFNVRNSTFASFEIGRRGIHVAQKGSQVTGQNMANVNTLGYTRQMMNQKAMVPPAVAGANTPPGYGVDITAINRVRSEFYDNQIRQALTSMTYWGQLGNTLVALEVIFLEPGDTGINTYLSEFFEAWQEISVNPESYAARVNLVEQAVTLTGVIQGMYRRMEELHLQVEKEINDYISEINVLGREIASLNKDIIFFQALGKVSNETLDERDLKLRQLSELIDVQAWPKTNGAIEVIVGGRTLVYDAICYELDTTRDYNDETRENEITIWSIINAKNDIKFKVTPKGGELLGLLESYNEIIPKYKAAMDDLAYNLVREVNQLHREGYGLDGSTGINFFVWDSLQGPVMGPMLDETVLYYKVPRLDKDGFQVFDKNGILVEDWKFDFPGVSFISGTHENQKLLNGVYDISTVTGVGHVDSYAELTSTYSIKDEPLIAGISVNNHTANKLNSSILFEVTKIEGNEIHVQYNFLHTKINPATGKPETVPGQGVKILKADDHNPNEKFGDDPDWTLNLNLLGLADASSFAVGDKFTVQVTAAANPGEEKISLEKDGFVAYEIVGSENLIGEQEFKFYQVNETTGEHRLVSLYIDPDMFAPALSRFTVGAYKPHYDREEIYQAAANFAVNPDLLKNPDKVAAAGKPGAPGDGESALAIARLREKMIGGLGEKTTFEDYFRGLMVDLGVQGREAMRLEYNMSIIYNNMMDQAESVSGVSLDDEMLNLVQYQHAYNAAAQFLSIVDQMLDTLINGIRR